MNKPNTHRLYSFRRCPYAMRARMALYNASISVEIIEVALNNKPQSLLNYSPKGTVPVLVTATENVIDESRDIMQWALQIADPDNWLLEGANTEMTELVDNCDRDFKPHLDHYKYFDRYPEQCQMDYRQQAEVYLRSLEKRLSQHSHLIDNRRRYADVAIFPFIRQFAGVEPDWFYGGAYPHLARWLECNIKSSLFTAIMHKRPVC